MFSTTGAEGYIITYSNKYIIEFIIIQLHVYKIFFSYVSYVSYVSCIILIYITIDFISPTHKRTEGRAPVWGSEFNSKRRRTTRGNQAETFCSATPIFVGAHS